MVTADEEEWRLAFHEAAHAVAGWAIGRPVPRLGLAYEDAFFDEDLEIKACFAGAVRRAPSDCGLDMRDYGEAVGGYIVYAAPLAAARMHLSDAGPADERDMAKAEVLLTNVAVPHSAPRNSEYDNLNDACWLRTNRAVAVPERGWLLFALARQLHRAGTMTGAEAFEFLDVIEAQGEAAQGDLWDWWCACLEA